jgi:uroporphyrinogen decarboxylase
VSSDAQAPSRDPQDREVVLLVRPDRNQRDADELASHGIATRTDPYLTVTPVDDPILTARLASALDRLGADDWVIIASPRTIDAWRTLDPGVERRLVEATQRGVRVAAVGARTAATLPVLPAEPLVGDGSGSASLLTALTAAGGHPAALLPGSSRTGRALPEGLEAAGWAVTLIPLYRTVTTASAPPSAAGLTAGHYAAVLLRSPSAVEAVARHAAPHVDTLVLAVGATTAAAARAHRWSVQELPSGTSRTIAAAARLLHRHRKESRP